MKKVISLLVITLVLTFGCTSREDHKSAGTATSQELRGKLSIAGADALQPLMQIWADEFMKLHPALQIDVSNGGTGKGLDLLEEGKADLAMVSRKLIAEEEKRGLVYFPVSREGVLPIISSGNPFGSRLMKAGFKRSTLIALYSSAEPLSWGDVLHTAGTEMVNPYTRADRSGAAEIWAGYLEINYPDLTGILVEGDGGMISAVSSDLLGVGYCNAHYAFDFRNKKVKEGLLIIPLDINENGIVDPRENLYDSLCNVQRAVYLGLFPSRLCREIALVSAGTPRDPNVIGLIRWIYGDGQQIARSKGYAELRQVVIRDHLLLLENADDNTYD